MRLETGNKDVKMIQPLYWTSTGKDAGTAKGKRGTYYLAACFVDGETLWPLYCEKECLGYFECKEDGKAAAEQHERGFK